MNKRRVVISGIGLLTACGHGWKQYWGAALSGESHIRRFTSMSLNGFPSNLAGEVPDSEAAQYIPQKKSMKVMSKTIKLAVAASMLAMQDSGIVLTDENRKRFGVSIGTGIINNELDEIGTGIKASMDESGIFNMKKFGQEGIRSLFPLWFLKYLPNMPACHISILHGLKGPSNTITTSSAASAQAIGEAYRVIERGDADWMLAGGADSKINAMGISRLNLLGLLSQRSQEPSEAYCPFDTRHDGLVIGEGSGLYVLEEREQAIRRGAKIYAEVLGYGCASDFNYEPSLDQDSRGKRNAIVRALEDADREPADIEMLIANGSGIPQEDIHEVRAIRSVFEGSVEDIKVTAVKPVAGHILYGAGGVDLAAGVLAVKEGVMPPVINLIDPAPECELPFVRQKPEAMSGKLALINSFGLCGQNASLVVSGV